MKILLYDEGVAEELKMEEISGYLEQKVRKAEVVLRGNPFVSRVPQDRVSYYATRISGIKVQQADKRVLSEQEPLYAEIEYERRRILGKTRSFGVPYEGTLLQRLFIELIPADERRLDFVHIWFTNRLFATWDDGDRRYHLRASVYGVPSIISTTGLVEAPAKPREYYLLKQQYERFGRDLTELNDLFRGRFIDYRDERLTEVAKGYAMQAVFYALTGYPFCEDKGCRLYNAHWQEELIFAQLDSGYEFCEKHARILESLSR